MSRDRVSCENFPLWYDQLMRMDESKRKKAIVKTMEKIKKEKPDTYKFIQDFDCELIGLIPNVSYSMPDNSEDSMTTTYVHDFSEYTLLFWCKPGGFSFFLNSVLNYNVNGLRGLVG